MAAKKKYTVAENNASNKRNAKGKAIRAVAGSDRAMKNRLTQKKRATNVKSASEGPKRSMPRIGNRRTIKKRG